MFGDGVNGATALATADVAIAFCSGTDVAVEYAGIVLVLSDPSGVVRPIGLSLATRRKMVQNLLWAISYILVAISVVAGVFIRWKLGILMSVGATR
jgi:Cu2+-exporting ATPase